MKSCFYFVLTLGLANAGCTSNADIAKEPDAGTTEAGPHPDAHDAAASCTTSAECDDASVCGFLESEGCSGHGVCLPRQSPCAIEATPGCGCDGTEINMTSCNDFLPGGYTLKPLAYAGACLSCPGSIVDAGGIGSSCTKSSECGTNELCAWPMSQSCADKSPGTCVAMVEGCHCVPPPACGCDGMEAITGCSASLPFGYSLSPFAYSGACIDGGTSCGDGKCAGGETCATCPQDCGKCPGDGG
jgi:hypothetical protein